MFEDFIVSVPGRSVVLLLRMLIAAICLCAGLQLFGVSRWGRLFTVRRIVSLFLIIAGLRIGMSAIFFFGLV